jgi:branched-chain amino acid transport system ATP-binding protein
MLAIGRALMTNPRLLLLDEPSLGLAPLVVEEIAAALGQINTERGLSILVAEQNAVLGLGMAQRGYVLNSGRIALQGDAAGLAQQGELIDSYLGSSMNHNERKVA